MILGTISLILQKLYFPAQTKVELGYIVYSRPRVVGIVNVDATTYRMYVAIDLQ